MKIFAIGLEKSRKDGERYITVGAEEINTIVRLLPALTKVSKRYATKRSPRLIDIPVEINDCDVGDLVTVMSLKENMYKRGQFDIDIRKCVKREDGSFRYTSEGVRFSVSCISEFEKVLQRYTNLMAKAEETSKRVVIMATAHVAMRELKELSGYPENCEGCQIDHPSQSQHMGTGGCLDSNKLTWEEVVGQFWQPSWHCIEDDAVQTLAEDAAAQDTEFKVGQKYLQLFECQCKIITHI